MTHEQAQQVTIKIADILRLAERLDCEITNPEVDRKQLVATAVRLWGAADDIYGLILGPVRQLPD
jgi:hypothetical protein